MQWPRVIALAASAMALAGADAQVCGSSGDITGDCGVCAAPVTAAVADDSTPFHTTLSKSARIAIVGGGVSGVSAAETFAKNGFSNVVVLEAGAAVVPLQHVVRTPEAVYDMDLIYVPALSWAGSGLEPRYEAVLREYAQELIPVSEFTQLSRQDWHVNASTAMHEVRVSADGSKRRRVPLLDNFYDAQLPEGNGFRRFTHVQRFFHAYADFYRRHQYGGVAACLAEGVARGNETFRAWTQRHDLDTVYDMSAQLLDLYGNFPVGQSPACQVLMLLANKLPAMLGGQLVLASAQPDFDKWVRESPLGPLDDTLLLWFAQIAIDMPEFMRRFRYGYGRFFSAVVLQNRIDYRTNARVAKLVPLEHSDASGRASGVRVEFAAEGVPAEHFDLVSVAGRPHQVHSILPPEHPMTALYGDVKTYAEHMTRSFGVYGVAILAFDVADDAGFVSQSRFVVDHQQHSVPMYDDALPAPVSVMRITKSADAKIMTAVFHTRDPAMVDGDDERALLFATLEQYGFFDLRVLRVQHYPHTPVRVPVDAIARGWYDRAARAQGEQRLFFIGETFSGHGVPTTFLHTRDWCVRTFALSADAVAPPQVQTLYGGAGTARDDMETPLVVNISADLAQMGTQTYMAMLRRPLEAIRLGVHPVLLIESPYDTGMPPVAFILCLLLSMALLRLFERTPLVKGVEWSKKKNVAIYCTEILVSSAVLAVLLHGCSEILLGAIPSDFLLATRRASLAGMLINGMYMCELVYHPRLRPVLRLHHAACIALYLLMLFCFAQHKATVVLQMGVYNIMNAVTEQTVFVFILLHRVAPHLLRVVPLVGYVLTACYALSRVLFGALSLYAWYQFATDDALAPARREFYGSIALVVYPTLTFVQISTQYDCFRVQLGLAKRYANAGIELEEADAGDAEEHMGELYVVKSRVRANTI